MENNDTVDYTIDFVTSSAISSISLKFLVFYVPILWIGGYMAASIFFDVSRLINNWIIITALVPIWFFLLYFIFLFGVVISARAFLMIINMIHSPKEGVFRAEKGSRDYEFWRLRIELKKLPIWIMSNSFLPWIVMWGFRWFGVKINFSSHLQDSWVDTDFVEIGQNVLVGQGAVVMSSMVVGKYLIIKKVILDDFIVIGGVAHVSPGTIMGKDSVLGAYSSAFFNQNIEPGWIYLGIPARKLKKNKYAEQRRDVIKKVLVDDEVHYEVEQDVNIEEQKKELLNSMEKED